LPLQAQTAADLHWIRSEFLNHRGDHGYVVVHGHSITTKVDEKPNRVGIDTGAWSSGKLTAVGLQGTERWFLQT
jgi:serine/threonine protein phosphatase 1